jgi:hypothetical protein
MKCHNLIKNDKEVYLELLKRFKKNCNKYLIMSKNCLNKSFNEKYGLWSKKQNKKLFNEIKAL